MADKLLFPNAVVTPTPALGKSWRKDDLRKAFHAYNEHVKATVPKDNLLVFEAKMGWGPLCAFLGVPVPTVPYPHVNDTVEFQKHIDTMNTTGMVIGVLGLGIPFLFMAPTDPSELEELEAMKKEEMEPKEGAPTK